MSVNLERCAMPLERRQVSEACSLNVHSERTPYASGVPSNAIHYYSVSHFFVGACTTAAKRCNTKVMTRNLAEKKKTFSGLLGRVFL